MESSSSAPPQCGQLAGRTGAAGGAGATGGAVVLAKSSKGSGGGVWSKGSMS